MCETRWAGRGDALYTFPVAFPVVAQALETLPQDGNGKTTGYLCSTKQFDFIIALCAAEHDLSNTVALSTRIGVLNRIKACLPFKQRMLYYNAMIKPLFSYGSVAWQSRCSNVCISRIFRLQKRAARVILNRETQAPTLPLFNKLKWLPFYTDTLISKCAILFKRIQLSVPDYLIEALKLNSSLHSRNNRFSKLNFLTPRYRLKTEEGSTFLVTAIEQWNS